MCVTMECFFFYLVRFLTDQMLFENKNKLLRVRCELWAGRSDTYLSSDVSLLGYEALRYHTVSGHCMSAAFINCSELYTSAFQWFTLWHFGSLRHKIKTRRIPFCSVIWCFLISLCVVNDYGTIALTFFCFHVCGEIPVFHILEIAFYWVLH